MTDTHTSNEGWSVLKDGYKLYTRTWKPIGAPKALLLFVHGFSDHANNQYTLFPSLAAQSIQTHAFDQRGWGRSCSKSAEKGLSGSTMTVLDDITQMLQTIIPVAASLHAPIFLMGHSMGGAEILQYAAKGPTDIRAQIRGYLAEAPYIALHPNSQPNRLVVNGGRLVAKIAPKRQMVQTVDRTLVSRDQQVVKDNIEDKLCHDTGTLEGLVGMLDRAHELDTGIVMPTEGSFWIGHGDADRVTSWDSSQKFVERLRVDDKTFNTYKGFYHKLHAEPGNDKTIVTNDIAVWILSRAEADSQHGQSKL